MKVLYVVLALFSLVGATYNFYQGDIGWGCVGTIGFAVWLMLAEETK